MNSSGMTHKMDHIIQQILKNRFEASISGISTENPSRLLSLTRDMGYEDLANELAKKLMCLRPVGDVHL